MRYRIYSIEYGFPPWNPYLETDDLDLAIRETKLVNAKYDVTVYVVDNEPLTMFEEIFVAVGSDFPKTAYRKYGSLPPSVKVDK